MVLTCVRCQLLRVPGVADLDAIDARHDVVVAGGADDGAGGGVAHHPGEHVTVALAGERVGDVGPGLAGRGDRGEPQPPQLAVRRGGGERVVMVDGERLEPDAVALEGDGAKLDHEAAPRTR